MSDALDPVLDDPAVLGATSYYDTNLDTLLSRDGRHALVLLSLEGDDAGKVAVFRRIEAELRAPGPGLEVEIGGNAAAATLAQDIAVADVRKAEALGAADRGAPHAVLLPERRGGAAARSDRRGRGGRRLGAGGRSPRTCSASRSSR